MGYVRKTAVTDALLFAALPWTPRSHHHYSEGVRARAIELMWLGQGFGHKRLIAYDVWMECIVPCALRLEFN